MAFEKELEYYHKKARRASFRELFSQDEKLDFSDKDFLSMNQKSAEKAMLRTLSEMRFMTEIMEGGYDSDEDRQNESEDDDE